MEFFFKKIKKYSTIENFDKAVKLKEKEERFKELRLQIEDTKF